VNAVADGLKEEGMQIGNAGTWHKEKRNAVQVQLCKKN
jgi:hypothetical protein